MFIKIEIYVYTRIHCGFRRLSDLSQVCASLRAVMTGRRVGTSYMIEQNGYIKLPKEVWYIIIIIYEVPTGRRDKSRNQHSGTHSGHTASMRKWINFLATVRQFSNSAQKFKLLLHERGFISIRFRDFETASKSMRFGSVYTEPFPYSLRHAEVITHQRDLGKKESTILSFSAWRKVHVCSPGMTTRSNSF